MDEVHARPPSVSSDAMLEDDISGPSYNTIPLHKIIRSEEQQGSESSTPLHVFTATPQPSCSIKRSRECDETGTSIDAEGFTTVISKSKRYLLIKQRNAIINDNNKNDVSLASKELLPKQIGLARIFKTMNITNVSKIKYKTPYKVIVSFECHEDAVRLVQNPKLEELGYYCHFTTEVNLSYGVVKYLELEITEEELMTAIKAECEIVSVKRLKRLSDSGEWVDSETVRFGFKGATLPTYVYGFDCRFKVEPYTFPVSQCNTCWKYGHTTRTCPNSKTTICPKCGGKHSNCETTDFKCVNCKGSHISFSKACPIFKKEKDIRDIMSKHNVTYKIALLKYYAKIPLHVEPEILFEDRRPDSASSPYSNAVRRPAKIPRMESTTSSEEETDKSVTAEGNKKKKKTSKKKSKRKTNNINLVEEKVKKTALSNKNTEDKKTNKNTFISILQKAKSIVFSEESFEEKVQHVLKLVFEELISFIVRIARSGEVFTKLVGLFYDG